MSLGFLAVLLVLGAMREVIGQGTLFTNMHLIFGEGARNWELQVFHNYPNFLFAVLPPGAFVGLGLLIATKNYFDDRTEQKRLESAEKVTAGGKRVRVTGTIS
jgi:electron transport complex protein RnfE